MAHSWIPACLPAGRQAYEGMTEGRWSYEKKYKNDKRNVKKVETEHCSVSTNKIYIILL